MSAAAARLQTTATPYNSALQTVAETAVFARYAAEMWRDEVRMEFITYFAANPEAGTLIPASGGCRKVRWSRAGSGKQGGARVIYFVAPDGVIWLLIAYAKAKFDNLPASLLAELRKEVERAR
jgi:hypothetical protein